jgi:hypothetical protein
MLSIKIQIDLKINFIRLKLNKCRVKIYNSTFIRLKLLTRSIKTGKIRVISTKQRVTHLLFFNSERRVIYGFFI